MMLRVSYRNAGQRENTVITAASLSWVETANDFILYNGDGAIISVIKPYYLHVKAVVNINDNRKE